MAAGAAFVLTLMYGKVMLAALAGHEHNAVGGGERFLALGAACWWYLFRWRGLRGWVGGLFGLALSVAVLVLGATLAAHERTAPGNMLENTPEIAALRNRHAQEYAEIERQIAAARDRGAQPAELQAMINAEVVPLSLKAIQATSVAALVEFGRAKLRLFSQVAARSADDCVLLMTSKAVEARPGALARILAAVPEESRAATRAALLRVIEEAGPLEAGANAGDAARFDALYQGIDARLKARGMNADHFGDPTKSADARCQAGLAVYDEGMRLPPPDAAVVLRRLMGAGPPGAAPTQTAGTAAAMSSRAR